MLSLSKDSLSSFYVPSTILDVRDGMVLINVQGIFHPTVTLLGFPGGSAVKNPPAMQETQVCSLGQEDTLVEGMATHSSILAWRIPIERGAWWSTVHGIAKSRP